MSSGEEESRTEERRDHRRKRSDSPRRRERDDRRKKHRRSRSNDRDSRSDRRRDHDRRRSRSPRDRHYRRNDRRGDKPIIPQRPKLFQRAPDAPTSSSDNNKWSTRIAAVASDDGQRSKFEKLLGMHKKPQAEESNKPALSTVDEKDVKSMRNELAKMEHDLNYQYEGARAFTHSFKGRGL